MPAGDPEGGLERATGLVVKWTSPEAAEDVRVAVLAAEPLPVTGSFVNGNTKDASLYGDTRAGLVLPVHFIPRGDGRAFESQDAILCLCMDYAAFICCKGFTSAALVRLVQAGRKDTLTEGAMAARRRCMCEGLVQTPLDLSAGHLKMQEAATAWMEEHMDRLLAPTQGGSLYGCGFSKEKVSTTGWFIHGPGARNGVQRSIKSMLSPTHGNVPLSLQAPSAAVVGLSDSLASSLPTPPPKGAEVSPIGSGYMSAEGGSNHSEGGALSRASCSPLRSPPGSPCSGGWQGGVCGRGAWTARRSTGWWGGSGERYGATASVYQMACSLMRDAASATLRRRRSVRASRTSWSTRCDGR